MLSMFASKNLHKRSFKSVSSLLRYRYPKCVIISREFSSNVVQTNDPRENEGMSNSGPRIPGPFESWSRSMSTWRPRDRNAPRDRNFPRDRDNSMRGRVERRMRIESGRTLSEVRTARRIQKKLMTDNERLVFNLKRAKKKAALLMHKLKKYELPDLPQPVHDPELFLPEQIQAYKKIGFKNKNYCPVGVRGVFGGVVQNMHMHWKFHETVQVCCDNFPKEKVKEMAMMITRLSGGVVVNLHDVKTVIMYRGRNYRQPKYLIPLNTLTKRKALFKARFGQALESQKLNIKKIEQQLRQSGVNPEDPSATASIQRVASSFFNAIDKKEGKPFIFNDNKPLSDDLDSDFGSLEPSDDKERMELDQFIADIEDAAEKEWAAEEAAEKEDLDRLRNWKERDYRERYGRPEISRGDDRLDDRSNDRLDDRSNDRLDDRSNRRPDDRSNDRNERHRNGLDSQGPPKPFRSDDDEDDDSDSDDPREKKMSRRNAPSKLDDDKDDDPREKKKSGRNAPSKSDDSDDSDDDDDDDDDDVDDDDYEEEEEEDHEVFGSMWKSDDDEDVGSTNKQNDSKAPSAINRNYKSESDDEETNERLVPNKTGEAKYNARSLEGDKDFEDSGSESESGWRVSKRASTSSDDEDGSYGARSDSRDETKSKTRKETVDIWDLD